MLNPCDTSPYIPKLIGKIALCNLQPRMKVGIRNEAGCGQLDKRHRSSVSHVGRELLSRGDVHQPRTALPVTAITVVACQGNRIFLLVSNTCWLNPLIILSSSSWRFRETLLKSFKILSFSLISNLLLHLVK